MNTGWLKDKTDNKIAPRTLISQVQDNSGYPLSDYINDVDNKILEFEEKLNTTISQIAELVGGDA